MNGYVEAGYIVVLGSLATYAASIIGRERAARRRLHESDQDVPVRTGEPSNASHSDGDGRSTT